MAVQGLCRAKPLHPLAWGDCALYRAAPPHRAGLRGCKPRGDALPHPPACGSASRAGPRHHICRRADLQAVWGQDAASAGVHDLRAV
ncbi:hypothetical protein GQ55_4G209700 [Panicum hallii var. hallii]|uniref:Uncharacterized protein n=1 Tax=Panicum hallii var. hallii TaxID=1504633 RepID=A0A2T7DZ87_9POAL|nr:hypothetical protein GQ55_4G209700 [Panicum hallii var. hallii]